MIRLVTLAALCLVMLPHLAAAQAAELTEETCDITAALVGDAQAMRVDGNTERRAMRRLARGNKELGEAYTRQVIPVVVNFVYMQSESVLDQDLSAAWKEQCLGADLSSAVPSE